MCNWFVSVVLLPVHTTRRQCMRNPVVALPPATTGAPGSPARSHGSPEHPSGGRMHQSPSPGLWYRKLEQDAAKGDQEKPKATPRRANGSPSPGLWYRKLEQDGEKKPTQPRAAPRHANGSPSPGLWYRKLEQDGGADGSQVRPVAHKRASRDAPATTSAQQRAAPQAATGPDTNAREANPPPKPKQSPPTAPPGATPLADAEFFHWVFDEPSGLYWSEEHYLYLDRSSGMFYDPNSTQWYDPKAKLWLPSERPLPDGDWVFDESSGLFWSDTEFLYLDRATGNFYDPKSCQWYNSETKTWSPNP